MSHLSVCSEIFGNAWFLYDLLVFQTGVGQAEDDSGDELDELLKEDVDDRLEETDADVLEAYEEMGLFAGPVKTLSAQDIRDVDERRCVRHLTKAMGVLSKAARIQSQALNVIKGVLEDKPSLALLAHILQLYSNFEVVNLAPGARVQKPGSHKTQVFQPGLYAHPVRKGKKFCCPLCPKEFGSWSGCDSHIRKEHSKMHYGPCPNCQFITTNTDSYTSHLEKCMGVVPKGKNRKATATVSVPPTEVKQEKEEVVE